jgi:glutamyl-tRNA synthetase
VGKYVELKDAYKSINEAIIHGGVENETKVNVKLFHSEQISEENVAKKLKDLDKGKIPFVVRIHKPKENIAFDDIIRGKISANPSEIDDFVILGADGAPTYDFACACDDITNGISMVVQSEDHLNNIPKQIHIMHSLNYDSKIKYAHLPAILNDSGKKMDERDKACTVEQLLREGFIPDAIINYLILLGNETPAEIFTMPEAAKWLDLRNISISPIHFDRDRLKHINRMHLGMMDDKKLSGIFGFADRDIGKLAKLFLAEASTINEIDDKIKAVFSVKKYIGKWKNEMRMISEIVSASLMPDDFEAFTKYIMEKTGLEEEKLLTPLSILLTGSEHEPKLSSIYPLIRSYITEVAKCQS